MNTIRKNVEAYCKSIAEAIHGGAIKGGNGKTQLLKRK